KTLIPEAKKPSPNSRDDTITSSIVSIRNRIIASNRYVTTSEILKTLTTQSQLYITHIVHNPTFKALKQLESNIDLHIVSALAVKQAMTLYDLEREIAEAYGVNVESKSDVSRFEKLGLGPLYRHPLIIKN